VTCCGITNYVTIANLNWSNQQTLFALPGAGERGDGIAFDSQNGNLYVSTGTGVQEFTLTGTLVASLRILYPSFDAAP
jgi:hypothetical protein